MTTSRRGLLKALAAVPLLAPAMLRAQDAGRIALAPIHVRDSRLWMPVRFGGGEAHGFIVDSGSFTNLVSESLAERLDLRRVGGLTTAGVTGVEHMPAYRAADVWLGEVRVGPMLFAAYPQDGALHPEAAGALSSRLMTIADADLDFDAGLWRLHLDGRAERTGYAMLPSTIRSAGPDEGAAKIDVVLDIDGERYSLVLDTGAPGDVLLAPAAARRSGLWNDRTPFSPIELRGVGGDARRARLVRAGRADLGGIGFDRPLITLMDPGSGERPFGRSDGLVGLGLIQRLNLSTDVARRRLWARPNAQVPRTQRYGMSGLWLEERPDGFEVVELSPRSPAADAGLRRGDRLLGGTLHGWVRKLGGPRGETIPIAYRRGGETGATTLTFRDYL